MGWTHHQLRIVRYVGGWRACCGACCGPQALSHRLSMPLQPPRAPDWPHSRPATHLPTCLPPTRTAGPVAVPPHRAAGWGGARQPRLAAHPERGQLRVQPLGGRGGGQAAAGRGRRAARHGAAAAPGSRCGGWMGVGWGQGVSQPPAGGAGGLERGLPSVPDCRSCLLPVPGWEGSGLRGGR